MAEQFDTVIVGSGSAGSVLANRLSENPGHRVLLLEAGRKDSWWDVFVHMPAGFSTPLGNPLYDWRYVTAPEPHMHGRRLRHARGRILGGSSSINGMIYLRGNPRDYDRWAELPGMSRWSHAHCLPYFRRAETQTWGERAFHGTDGPLRLEPGPCENPLFEAFFRAMGQAGYAPSRDLNGYRQEGYGIFDRNIVNGRRQSAARAYLHPVWHRPQLTVRTHACVQRVLFDGRRAVGLTYRRFGRRVTVHAGRVICCAGAINTPKLLQLSGVGPAGLLRQHGVEVVHDLPGVGENLQDHLEVYIQHACAQPVSMVPALQRRQWPWIGWQWLWSRTGPASSNHFEAGAFLRTSGDEPYPNAQLHFLPLAIRYDGTPAGVAHGYQVHAGPNLSDARGHVRIRSRNPAVHPEILFNYLSIDKDRRDWLALIRQVRRVLAQSAFDAFDAGEISPGPAVRTDAELLDWVRADGETALHPSCSCKLGTDPMAVVHPDTFAVHGVEGLYVVDASIFPLIPNANLHCTTVMVAERAADALCGRALAVPEPVDFYVSSPEPNHADH